MIGKFPTCVLHLTMPFDTVDVNVHPNKLEVRFQNERGIYDAVEAIVRDALTERDALEKPAQLLLTPEKPPEKPVQVTKQSLTEPPPKAVAAPAAMPKPAPEIRPRAPIPAIMPRVDAVPPVVSKTVMRDSGAMPAIKPMLQNRPESEQTVKKPTVGLQMPAREPEQVPSFLPDAPKPMKLMGVAFNTFILVEYEDNLLMIDQHAVHERLLFDRMMKAYDQHEAGQELLVPMLVGVTRREQQLLNENRELLEGIGLMVEPFGEQQVSIRSIPMILGNPQAKDFLRDILDQLESERGVISMEKRRSAILQLACKKAVKGGDALSEAEIRDLVTRMIDQHVTPTCPHGRPLVISLSHQELDKRFKRIQ